MTKTKLVNLDIKLIGLVKDNPVLYDHNHPSYMDYNAREVVWQKIGDEMKRPASECKARWINIRDINRRIIRKSVRNPGGSVRMYKYFNDLSFMRPFYRDVMIHAKRKSELAEDEENSNRSDADEGDYTFVNNPNSDDSDDDKPIVKRKVAKTCPTISVIKTSKKHSDNTEKLLEVDASNINDTNIPTDLDPTDKVDSFLLSIGTTLKTFSPYHLNLAKSKIFAVVQEHELQQIVSKHGQSSSNANDMAIE